MSEFIGQVKLLKEIFFLFKKVVEKANTAKDFALLQSAFLSVDQVSSMWKDLNDRDIIDNTFDLEETKKKLQELMEEKKRLVRNKNEWGRELREKKMKWTKLVKDIYVKGVSKNVRDFEISSLRKGREMKELKMEVLKNCLKKNIIMGYLNAKNFSCDEGVLEERNWEEKEAKEDYDRARSDLLSGFNKLIREKEILGETEDEEEKLSREIDDKNSEIEIEEGKMERARVIEEEKKEIEGLNDMISMVDNVRKGLGLLGFGGVGLGIMQGFGGAAILGIGSSILGGGGLAAGGAIALAVGGGTWGTGAIVGMGLAAFTTSFGATLGVAAVGSLIGGAVFTTLAFLLAYKADRQLAAEKRAFERALAECKLRQRLAGERRKLAKQNIDQFNREKRTMEARRMRRIEKVEDYRRRVRSLERDVRDLEGSEKKFFKEFSQAEARRICVDEILAGEEEGKESLKNEVVELKKAISTSKSKIVQKQTEVTTVDTNKRLEKEKMENMKDTELQTRGEIHAAREIFVEREEDIISSEFDEKIEKVKKLKYEEKADIFKKFNGLLIKYKEKVDEYKVLCGKKMEEKKRKEEEEKKKENEGKKKLISPGVMKEEDDDEEEDNKNIEKKKKKKEEKKKKKPVAVVTPGKERQQNLSGDYEVLSESEGESEEEEEEEEEEGDDEDSED